MLYLISVMFIVCIYLFINLVCYKSHIRKKKKIISDELLNRRIKFLKQKQYDYYYSMALNSPEILSDILAEKDIERIKNSNMVFSLYTKAKG